MQRMGKHQYQSNGITKKIKEGKKELKNNNFRKPFFRRRTKKSHTGSFFARTGDTVFCIHTLSTCSQLLTMSFQNISLIIHTNVMLTIGSHYSNLVRVGVLVLFADQNTPKKVVETFDSFLYSLNIAKQHS